MLSLLGSTKPPVMRRTRVCVRIRLGPSARSPKETAMSAALPLVRRSLVAAAAVMSVMVLSSCGSGGAAASAAAAKEDPYGLQQAGTLRVGTLTDAPPNVYLKDGKFTGFDNDLFTAVASKLDLKVQFVGRDFSALLAQVKNKKFDLGSSSITITDARKKTVAFTNGCLLYTSPSPRDRTRS